MGQVAPSAITLGTCSMTSSTLPEVNPNCAQAFASLRLFGDELVPDTVTHLLHVQPTDVAPKGLKTALASGRVRTAPTGRWLLATQEHLASTNLESHIKWLLDRIESTGVSPADIPGVSRAEICCFWVSATGNGGPEFSPELLGRLARLRLTLSFDLYFDAQ